MTANEALLLLLVRAYGSKTCQSSSQLKWLMAGNQGSITPPHRQRDGKSVPALSPA